MLTMKGGGIASHQASRWSEAIYKEAQQAQPIPLGGVAVTASGTLRQKLVFHAAVLDRPLDDIAA